MSSRITTSQTIGPFPHEGFRWAIDATAAQLARATIVIEGQVLDGAGAPIDDAMLEGWAPLAEGAEQGRPLPGFRRVPTDERGAFRFEISTPAVASEPALFITLFARGLLQHQFSAVFVDADAAVSAEDSAEASAGESGALAQSSILQQVPASRRGTLIARKTAPGRYRWDIRMQGENETVFFDFT